MGKRITISDERILYEIFFTLNEIVEGGFNYIQSRVMTIEEAEGVLKLLTIPEEIINEHVLPSSIEH